MEKAKEKSPPQPNIISYSYDEMKQDLLDIIRSMNLDEWQPDVILGIARGGLVPATMISHYFDIPLIPVNLSLRDFKSDTNTVANELDQSMMLDFKKYKNLLVVDDIVDSGATVSELNDIFKLFSKFSHFNIKYATLYYNETNEFNFVPNYWARKIDKSKDASWIVFPPEVWWKD